MKNLVKGWGLFVGWLALAGCCQYEANPVDWAREESTWRETSARLPLATMQEAETLALLANPEINRLRLKAQMGEKEALEAGWWEDPQVNVDFLRVLRADDYPNIFGGSLAFTLPLSGVPGLESLAAAQYAQADAWAVKAAEKRLVVDVRVAAIRWAAAQWRVSTLRTLLADNQLLESEARVANLVKVGEVDETDFIAVRRRRQARRYSLTLAEQECETARAAFCRLLGILPSVEVSLPDDVWTTNGAFRTSAPLPLELVGHPLVQAEQVRFGGTEAALKAEIRRQYPDLTIGPAYSREDGFNRVGFVAGLTLPLWNRNRLGVARAETERNLSRLAAIETWKTLVSDSVLAARLVQRLRQHVSPNGLAVVRAEHLHAAGELSDLAYLSAWDEAVDTELAEISWRESLLVAESELRFYSEGDGVNECANLQLKD